MLKKNASTWAGMFFLGIAILFFMESLHYEYIGQFGPGPAMFPVWLSAILGVLSLLYIAESFRNPLPFLDFLPAKEGRRNIVNIIGLLAFLICIISFTGFVIASTIFLFVLFNGEYKWYTSLGMAFCISICLFVLFDVLLQIPLPVNILGW
ncbi:tripartite tricarboxylate transporter TctB family protein [Brevibacillus sp. H7]|uniref:tripartite tricarboxylate transporter TctB family protein n=1 Tax=Brevibacillus sp. H7 TaxID=3349138 RepID=UPI00381F696B